MIQWQPQKPLEHMEIHGLLWQNKTKENKRKPTKLSILKMSCCGPSPYFIAVAMIKRGQRGLLCSLLVLLVLGTPAGPRPMLDGEGVCVNLRNAGSGWNRGTQDALPLSFLKGSLQNPNTLLCLPFQLLLLPVALVSEFLVKFNREGEATCVNC